MTKVCIRCNIEKAENQFPKKGIRAGKQRFRSECSDCFNEYQKKIPKRERYGYDRTKHWNLGAKFGITLETYNIMLESQSGVCAICGDTNSNGRALAVDHDHETGQIRQLLCGNCNSAIGLLKDDPELVMKAALYLTKHKKVI